MKAAIDLDFADGTYTFDLKLPQLAELQEKCGAGVFAIYGRVMRGRGVLDGEPIGMAWQGEAFDIDLFETIRLGLIGGGIPATEAKKLVERYCHPAPLRESWALAAAILMARVEGYDPPKKAAPDEVPASDTTSTLDGSSQTAP
ncbi:gene transfer agent family protein [Sphingobium sp. BS19]|uniref:gene transfer agent family protein n=1 Tax=Sphingobium sp. BS19 TaxID=3018973 RepID=UPI0022EDC2DF|nr:gene transfer agent family protein [Sphingobium sp. BS19]GLI99118.1 hypothetical protein Sbs19_29360 [Sphingobium sp. BS19]